MGSGESKHKHQGSRGSHQTATDRPSPPGKPYLIPGSPRSDPDVITIKWIPPIYNGGTKITGYLVEHKRTGSPHWVKSTPLLVRHTQLCLSGLEPGMRYQFRVTAENCMGRSEPGQISEPFAISYNKGAAVAPVFAQSLADITAIENDKVEFLVQVEGTPMPKISWFKDGFEVFSNRRQRVSTDGDLSSFVIHQVSLSDEGEIKCSATNKAGHAVAKAKLTLEAPPSIRLPRQYEDGLLFELGEVVRFKISVTGRPQPTVTWLHNGNILLPNNRLELATTERYAMLRISEAKREDRGEYQVKAKNTIGDDIASFLVTITDRPLPPGKVAVVMTLGRCVTLSWCTPDDDGGCKIGNYIVEYYRIGWNMWLKAATCRQLTTTIGDLIEGSEYKFRVKAENPYGISDPSDESDTIFIPDPKRGLLEPPARGEQIQLIESSEQWLENHKQQEASKSSSKADRKDHDWTNEEDETPLPSPVVLANQVLRKVKLAPKRGWSEDSQPSFEEPETETPPPIPPKRKHKPLTATTNEKKFENRTLADSKQWETREFSPRQTSPSSEDLHSSSEMMLVLVPNSREETVERDESDDRITAEDLIKQPLIAPPMSLSAPVLGSCEPVAILRASVSSSEIMYELTLSRLNQEVDLEETENNLRKKYGIERRRSFEKRNIKIRPGGEALLEVIREQSVSLENVNTRVKNEEKNNLEENNDNLPEIKISDQFSQRFQQLEKSFKDYSSKYEFENNPSDIESIDRMSFDYSDEIDEDTYHPRAPKGTFTPITIQVPEIQLQILEIPSQISLTTKVVNDVSDSPSDEELVAFRNRTEFNRSNTPSPEVLQSTDYQDSSSSMRSDNSPLRLTPEPVKTLLLTPKPILKVRDRSVDRSDVSDNEHTPQKKVRIEAPDDNKDSIDSIAREENDIGLYAGEIARNRRMKLQRNNDHFNDPTNVIISHYSDIVREYGQPKRSQTKLYLSYEELKAAADRSELNESILQANEICNHEKLNTDESIDTEQSIDLIQSKNITIITKTSTLFRDFVLNLCLFFIACWLYLFNDPLLVIPILILMMYRQLTEILNKKFERFYKKK